MHNNSGEKHFGSGIIAYEFASSINSKIVELFFSSIFLSFCSNRSRSRKGNRTVKMGVRIIKLQFLFQEGLQDTCRERHGRQIENEKLNTIQTYVF